jgi:hypothetical protein
MTKVWIVEGVQYEDDDSFHWVAGVFESEADARDWVFNAEAAFEVLFPQVWKARKLWFLGLTRIEADHVIEITTAIRKVDGRVATYLNAPTYSVSEYLVFPATFKRSAGGRE